MASARPPSPNSSSTSNANNPSAVNLSPAKTALALSLAKQQLEREREEEADDEDLGDIIDQSSHKRKAPSSKSDMDGERDHREPEEDDVKQTKKRKLLEHFKKHSVSEDGTFLSCNICAVNGEKQILKLSKWHSMSNFTRHLESQHPVEHERIYGQSTKPFGRSRRRSDIDYANSERHKEICRRILKLTSVMKPFRLVETTAFRELVTYLDPRFTVPERDTFSGPVLELHYCKATVNLLQKLASCDSDLAVSGESWSSGGLHFGGATVHFLDPQFFAHSLFLGFEELGLTELQNPASAVGLLRALLRRWDIDESRVSAMVVECVGVSAAVRSGGDFDHPVLGCTARMLNQLMTGGPLGVLSCSPFAEAINKARAISLWYKSSLKRQTALRHELDKVNVKRVVAMLTANATADTDSSPFGKNMGSPSSAGGGADGGGSQSGGLKLDEPSRWDSTMDMVGSVVKCRPAIQATLTDGSLQLNNTEWGILEEMVEVVQPIRMLQMELQAVGHPTLSLVLPLIEILKTLAKPRDQDSTFKSTFKRLLGTSLDARLAPSVPAASSQSPATASSATVPGDIAMETLDELVLAAFLDPRFKAFRHFPPADRPRMSSRAASLLADAIRTLPPSTIVCKPDPHHPSVPTSALPPGMEDANSSFWDITPDDDEHEPFTTTGATESESEPAKMTRVLSAWAAVPAVKVKKLSDLDVLGWWRDNASKHPEVARVARRLLAIPASCAPVDRLFSKGSLRFAEVRSSLQGKMMDKLLFLAENSSLW